MASNGKAFATWLRKMGRELPAQRFMPFLRAVAFKILEGAVQNSPVNTGRLRNGWHVTEGSASGADAPAGDSEHTVLAAGQTVLNGAEFGADLFIQNNVPYAPIYEYGLFDPPDPGPSKATHIPKSRRDRVRGVRLIKGGYHVSAPHGMLGDAMQQALEAAKAGQL